MGLFGKSVESRYAEVAASFAPTGRSTQYPDPVTWTVLRIATDAARNHYASTVASAGNLVAARKLWENEIFRLVVDGYLLGRIEEGTERHRLRFSDFADDLAQETGEFVTLSASYIRAGLELGQFSPKPPSDIMRVMDQFSMDAVGALDDVVATDDDNRRSLGVALVRAVNLGRQIALIEGFYLNRKKRPQLQEIRTHVERDELQRVRQMLKDAGIKTPEEAAELILARVRDEIKGSG
jgi:hypothetical protein